MISRKFNAFGISRNRPRENVFLKLYLSVGLHTVIWKQLLACLRFFRNDLNSFSIPLIFPSLHHIKWQACLATRKNQQFLKCPTLAERLASFLRKEICEYRQCIGIVSRSLHFSFQVILRKAILYKFHENLPGNLSASCPNSGQEWGAKHSTLRKKRWWFGHVEHDNVVRF